MTFKNRKISRGSFSLVTFSLALAAFVIGASTYAASELAKVNGRVITIEEFNKRYDENLKFYHVAKPSKADVLEDLIKRELGIQEAKRLGLDKDPEIVDRMNTVLYHALLEKELAKKFEEIHVTDEQAQEYYKRNPEIRTSHIFVSVNPGAGEAKDKEAQRKIREILDLRLGKEKMSFAEAAQRYSEGPSAPMGGDLDYKTKDQLDPAYYEAAVKLGTPGKVSGIIRSQFGYHIIKLTAVRAWRDTDRPKIKRLVFEERRQELFNRYMTDLRKKSAVSVNSALLK